MQDWVFRVGSLVIYVGGRSYEVVCGWNGAYKRHVRFPFITSSRHPIPTLLLQLRLELLLLLPLQY